MPNKNNGSKNQTSSTETKKDGLALVVGGVFLLSLVFATYNYFTKGDVTTKDDNNSSVFQKKAGTKVMDSDTETNEIVEGDLNGEGTSTAMENTPTSNQAGAIENVWQANDYKEGDIQGTSYTVVAGDTLWEIAEAVYGNGSDWTRLLGANSSSIGYLANGQQALIVPGQVLVLP